MTPPGDKASIAEDFMDILYEPSKVFARRAAGGYGMHLLIIAVLAGLFAFANRGVFEQIFDAEFQRGAAKAMAANPQITMDQMNSMRGIQEKVAMIATFVGTPIFIFVLAFFTWLAAKIASAKVTYQQAVLIVSLAWIPRLVGSLVATLQVVLMDTASVTNMFSLSASPARFMDPDTSNPKVFGLMGGLDVFSIWYTVVAAIGIATIAKVPRSKGYIASFMVFALAMLPALLR
ncbi:MAG: YIP1 family protein [Gemmatimonadota bacterium]